MKKILILSILVSGFVAGAEVVTIKLPVETATLRPGVGVDVANANCLTCHSADYPSMQPPKPRDYWAGEVVKMKAKYGAPISDDVTNTLIDYFAKTYGTDKGETPTTVSFDSTILDPHTLATKMGCLTCHSVDKKIIGPAYKDVAAKYANNPDAVDAVRKQIMNGGSGKWGTVPMPGYKIMSDAQVDALAHWVLSQKGQ